MSIENKPKKMVNRSIALRFIFLICATFSFNLEAKDPLEKPIVVLTTSYNNQKWLEKNVLSILNQKYSNYRVIYVDDCSKDGTADLVEELVKKSKQEFRFTLIRNPERKGALENIYNAVHSCMDDEIIVSLDGDDWFPDNLVLNKINRAYTYYDIWLTHGTLIEYPSGHMGWSIPIPKRNVYLNSFRDFRCPSHLRTFYAWLFKKIRKGDLMYEGKFFPMTWDQAMMFPMIEMAGERHGFINDIVYVYNVENAINDNKVNAKLQNDLEAYIRAMPAYSRLQDKDSVQEVAD